mmetsp:Transcript_15/g.46  ORF Transcript_15/g.46 Transcript_15/m.46 type:complete len:250 (-) Transcript_15:238-987(-)|eukprot:CAMPEP_0201124158 /NCGR_PEP_ID=MMETSP0850-20130426/10589_1 /ASSEMBLY_ACC=CAM_ASM_000622 /TAXON_ID=183588 /ORGANISM="Pseudo-nitzschia fraudulenta, Strain WWA7" /LENGTH=249 /DNA_ID=CAMNT_0047391353 /DNA_START=30 /DNA_END=779 /DNA_ORIENTATION=+
MIYLRNLMDDSDDLENSDHVASEIISPCPNKKVPLSHDRSPLVCQSAYDCAPGMVLSDSEESSFASCGTDDFFDLEEISNKLNLIESWHKLRRRVKFGSTHVQEYAITVGDHPICKDGLALSLDWAHAKEQVYDIDDYEMSRQRESRRRGVKRRRRVSKLDYWQRREILNRVGSYTNADLSRIECKRNREAVSAFLQDVGADDFGPSVVEPEEEGIELEQVYGKINDDSTSLFSVEGHGWQMNVQILEG